MNVVNIWRNRSGEAWASCSSRNRVGSILLGAVIAWFSCRTVEGLQEDHAMAVLLVYATPVTRPAVHHSAGLHCRVLLERYLVLRPCGQDRSYDPPQFLQAPAAARKGPVRRFSCSRAQSTSSTRRCA